MEELLKAVNAYITKVATEAAQQSFATLVADKLQGLSGDDHEAIFTEKAEEAIDRVMRTLLIKRQIEEAIDDSLAKQINDAVEDFDLNDMLKDKAKTFFETASFKVTVS